MRKLTSYQEELLFWADEYIGKGWGVLPIKSNGKVPLNSGGSRNPIYNFKEIYKWIISNPRMNLGVVAEKGKFFVIDVDVKNGGNGFESLINFVNQLDGEIDGEKFVVELLNKRRCQMTPSGGVHIFVDWDKDLEVGNFVNVLDKVDIRGDGGYVVVCPSYGEGEFKNVRYQWNEFEFVNAKRGGWVDKLLSVNGNNVKSVDLVGVFESGIRKGARDTDLFKVARLLLLEGVSIDVVREVIRYAGSKCKPSFDLNLCDEKVNSAVDNIVRFERKVKSDDKKLEREKGKLRRLKEQRERIERSLGE